MIENKNIKSIIDPDENDKIESTSLLPHQRIEDGEIVSVLPDEIDADAYVDQVKCRVE